MAESTNQNQSDDNDLLANAIPIDSLDDDSDLEVIEDDGDENELAPIELEGGDEEVAEGDVASSKIQALGKVQRHAEQWKRTPNATGTGAIHCKTFVAKLRLDAIEYLDEQVNHWLDSHPEYEVKLVTTNIGPLIGKTTENALFVNVWV